MKKYIFAKKKIYNIHKLPFQSQRNVEGDGSASINVEDVEHRGAGWMTNNGNVFAGIPQCICRRGLLPSGPSPVSSKRPTASTVPLVSSIGAVPHVPGRSRGRPPRDYAASINTILDVGLVTKSYYIKIAPRRAVSSRFFESSEIIVT